MQQIGTSSWLGRIVSAIPFTTFAHGFHGHRFLEKLDSKGFDFLEEPIIARRFSAPLYFLNSYTGRFTALL